jgi:competence protein ComEC
MHENPTAPLSLYFAWLLFVGLFIASVVVWIVVVRVEHVNPLKVAFLDVGQGDAIYIETPHGNQVLIDGGKGRVVLRELGHVMPFFDRSIDVVIASHPDLDHIEGLPEVFERYAVSKYFEAGVEEDSPHNKALHQAVQNEGLVINEVEGGMDLLLDEDVILHFFFPDRDARNLESNTASVVAKLTYKDTSFLFTGDSPAGIETYLATSYGDELQSGVLKLSHHGSRTSSTDIFLGYVNPKYAVISAGCENPYGHPHDEVLKKLDTFEIAPVRTCEKGTIIFESDGVEVSPLSL